MKRFLSATALAGLLGVPAFAGSVADPVVEPVVAEPVAVASPRLGGDWTGPYVGLQFGNIDVDGTGTADGEDLFYGVHLGYDYDFGRFVLGGEIDYDTTDVDLNGAATVDSVARLKLRGGFDAGPALIYLTAGVADVDTSLGSENGEFYGLGLAYRVNDRFTIGGEILEHKFEDINGSGVDADATTVSIRGSFRF